MCGHQHETEEKFSMAVSKGNRSSIPWPVAPSLYNFWHFRKRFDRKGKEKFCVYLVDVFDTTGFWPSKAAFEHYGCHRHHRRTQMQSQATRMWEL